MKKLFKKDNKNMIGTIAGFSMIVIGVLCIVIKSLSIESIDEYGVLHENFYLLPISALFFLGGFITFIIIGIKNITAYANKDSKNKLYLSISVGAVLLILGLLCLLIYTNSGINLLWLSIIITIFSMCSFIYGLVITIKNK